MADVLTALPPLERAVAAGRARSAAAALQAACAEVLAQAIVELEAGGLTRVEIARAVTEAGFPLTGATAWHVVKGRKKSSNPI
ncbi:hypothetical protein [Frankia sp. Cj3]|uniref:hypothetical protein n=1 Tax=Frankia sp. Cj3 TaxID=2880976 RepID=UPI001EF3E5A7|nr:hypothetical protein [Frankia sp. Cj3]